ncbi:MAG: GNAT family N-acetyltransferase [Myxococcales bacterium]|nr:GNAT family N-acetyltransferase [Myxococcales bacterium]
MDVRPLRDGEQEALLDLLDLWPMVDAFRARDFFARYVTGDPRFDPRDVFVGVEGGGIVSCVQIFPKKVVVRGRSVPLGGIGSVFTHPDHRKLGVASSVLTAAMADLSGRGMELGLLFAGPVGFYESHGWHVLPIRRPLLRPGAPDPAVLTAAERFEAARDLAEVAAIHEAYGADREGLCLRDRQDWWTSLANAGNPDEEFLVHREGGRVTAYLRAVCLNRFLLISEWGRTPEAAEPLAALFAAALCERPEDPIAPEGRTSAEFRKVAATVPLLDAGLEQALGARGIGIAHVDDARTMVWLAQPEIFAQRYGEPFRSGDSAEALLRRILPYDRFGFWQSDRF